MVLEETERQVP